MCMSLFLDMTCFKLLVFVKNNGGDKIIAASPPWLLSHSGNSGGNASDGARRCDDFPFSLSQHARARWTLRSACSLTDRVHTMHGSHLAWPRNELVRTRLRAVRPSAHLNHPRPPHPPAQTLTPLPTGQDVDDTTTTRGVFSFNLSPSVWLCVGVTV